MSSVRSSSIKGEIDGQASFESMRGHSNHAQLMRRHKNLRREGDMQLRAIERETRLKAMTILRIQSEYSNKMKKFQSLEEDSRSRLTMRSRNKHQVNLSRPKLQKEKKEVLLFRIEKRDGRDIYIKEATKKPVINDIFSH